MAFLEMVNIVIREEPIERIGVLAAIPIRFEVRSVLEPKLDKGGLAGIRLEEKRVKHPWTKDYDAERGEGPARLPRRFDVSSWGLLTASDGTERIGGALIAWKTPEVHLLEERTDLAVLWDLRVHPERRGRGSGTALFRVAEHWARSRGCTQLKIETQNVNVPACRFYAKQGCTLGGINRFAYPKLPEETQLLWYKELAP